MKTILLRNILIVCVIATLSLVGCIGDGNKMDTTDTTAQSEVPKDQIIEVKPILWTYDAVADSMIKHHIPDSLTIELVLQDLNKRYKETKLELIRTSADTAFMKVDDVSYLAGLGSSGNYGFIAEVVYSLTEVPGINLVHLDFEELDHAVPGLYNREDMDNKL